MSAYWIGPVRWTSRTHLRKMWKTVKIVVCRLLNHTFLIRSSKYALPHLTAIIRTATANCTTEFSINFTSWSIFGVALAMFALVAQKFNKWLAASPYVSVLSLSFIGRIYAPFLIPMETSKLWELAQGLSPIKLERRHKYFSLTL